MHVKKLLAAALFILLPLQASAADEHPSIFHSFMVEAQVGDSREGTLTMWDFDGWVGGDYNKLWLKSEGEVIDGDTHSSEYWAMYSRNIA